MAYGVLQLISTQRATVARVADGRRPPQQAAQGVERRGSFGDERGAPEAELVPAQHRAGIKEQRRGGGGVPGSDYAAVGASTVKKL